MAWKGWLLGNVCIALLLCLSSLVIVLVVGVVVVRVAGALLALPSDAVVPLSFTSAGPQVYSLVSTLFISGVYFAVASLIFNHHQSCCLLRRRSLCAGGGGCR